MERKGNMTLSSSTAAAVLHWPFNLESDEELHAGMLWSFSDTGGELKFNVNPVSNECLVRVR